MLEITDLYNGSGHKSALIALLWAFPRSLVMEIVFLLKNVTRLLKLIHIRKLEGLIIILNDIIPE